MTAKKKADIFFKNFSDLITSEKISRETEVKPISESTKDNKKLNKNFIIITSALILLGIVIYLII